jgi:mannitol 2-dehydrogenase
VHFGVGHFHRAHQAVYVDRALRLGPAQSQWAICGVGVTGSSPSKAAGLAQQDYLYTVTQKLPSGETRSQVIGSITSYLTAVNGPEAIIAKVANPHTRIVSLTVTEAGYEVQARREPQVVAGERAEDTHGGYTTSAAWMGPLLRGLQLRRRNGLSGLSVVSCDNMQANGHVARSALLEFAKLHDGAMVPWIEEEVTFPGSMVDRVVPGTTSADIAYLKDQFGYSDDWPVTCEPFSGWVLEDSFVAGRPRWEEVGVEMVSNVGPYEAMKLRLANGTHQVVCYFGVLLGYTYVPEAIADPDIRALVTRYIVEEAVPTLVPIVGTDLVQWGLTVIERFGNPQLQDPLARICEQASVRIPKFLLPVAVDQLKRGGPVSVCAAVIASWARYLEGKDESGKPIEIRDPLKESLVTAAGRQDAHPSAFIDNVAVFGDLAKASEFSDCFVEALAIIHGQGARALLQRLAARN